MLIVVTVSTRWPRRISPDVGLISSSKILQQRRLAAAVGAHDAEPLAARQGEAQILEKRHSNESLAQIVDFEDDVAGAQRRRRSACCGDFDQGRPFDALELVEHFCRDWACLCNCP